MQTRLDDFPEIKQAFEEHLTAINETTAEMQVLFDFLQVMERKLDSLSQRVDQIQITLQNNPALARKQYALNQMENQIFFALYTEETPLTFQEIAVKANLPAALVPEGISALIEKGIPLIKSFYNDRLFLKLEQHFKELQARENIISLSLQGFMG